MSDNEYQSECVPIPHRITHCPRCGEPTPCKSPSTTRDGRIIRARYCLKCLCVYWTEQPPEKIVSVEEGLPGLDLILLVDAAVKRKERRQRRKDRKKIKRHARSTKKASAVQALLSF